MTWTTSVWNGDSKTNTSTPRAAMVRCARTVLRATDACKRAWCVCTPHLPERSESPLHEWGGSYARRCVASGKAVTCTSQTAVHTHRHQQRTPCVRTKQRSTATRSRHTRMRTHIPTTHIPTTHIHTHLRVGSHTRSVAEKAIVCKHPLCRISQSRDEAVAPTIPFLCARAPTTPKEEQRKHTNKQKTDEEELRPTHVPTPITATHNCFEVESPVL